MAWHLRWKPGFGGSGFESGVEMAWGYFNHGSHISTVFLQSEEPKNPKPGLIWSLPVLSALTAPL